ncbi:MAG TPA: 6,7-dimethyl-8-ribityllumazine synthase [Acidimicrobiales bacterium]|nr:6,7-dimethyl-8-ribityllumazine synthase [Acidimicrobiales bacterium]
MTSSDATALSANAVDDAARRVHISHVGDVASEARVALVCAKFNGGITERLLDGALLGLDKSGIKPSAVTVAWVPGAFELPLAAMRLAESGSVDAVVALGAVIRGETAHFDFVAGECASGLQRAALDTGIPVVFGVLTTDTVDQALARCSEGDANKGFEAAVTALEMADLLRKLPGPSPARTR